MNANKSVQPIKIINQRTVYNPSHPYNSININEINQIIPNGGVFWFWLDKSSLSKETQTLEDIATRLPKKLEHQKLDLTKTLQPQIYVLHHLEIMSSSKTKLRTKP